MLQKGTKDYRKAQLMANLFEDACLDRKHYELFGMFLEEAVHDIVKLNCFGAQVAQTIITAIEKYGMPRVSSKQAWILACTAAEQGWYYSR